MRIRDRLRRAWRWAQALLAPPSPAPRVSSPSVSLTPAILKAAPPTDTGDRVTVGDVTLRLWTVGHLVVLATGDAEAEQALVSLVGHPDQTVRTAAARRLDALRGDRAAAA